MERFRCKSTQGSWVMDGNAVFSASTRGTGQIGLPTRPVAAGDEPPCRPTRSTRLHVRTANPVPIESPDISTAVDRRDL